MVYRFSGLSNGKVNFLILLLKENHTKTTLFMFFVFVIFFITLHVTFASDIIIKYIKSFNNKLCINCKLKTLR